MLRAVSGDPPPARLERSRMLQQQQIAIRRHDASGRRSRPTRAGGDWNLARRAYFLDHKDVGTTMVYPHVLNRGMSMRSPLEELGIS